jgi:putative SOS response-associated peptidase YedK
MCGRFQQSSPLDKLQDRFGFTAAPLNYRPRWNLAPGQEALVVRAGAGGREGAMLRWGLVPSWAQDDKSAGKMINARAEGLAGKPAFGGPLRRFRCLVPADGFYEWAPAGGGKQPYRLFRKDGEPFALAGLWDRWRNSAGDELQTFTIITTQANRLAATIHQRMPVMLARGDEDPWLDPASDLARLEGLLRPYPAGEMKAVAVSRQINSAACEGPEIIKPVETQGGLFDGWEQGGDS